MWMFWRCIAGVIGYRLLTCMYTKHGESVLDILLHVIGVLKMAQCITVFTKHFPEVSFS